MPTCVQEIGPATAAVTRGHGRSTTVTRVPAGPSGATFGSDPTAVVILSERDRRVLAVVDGPLSLRSLVDVSGMTETEALKVVDRLVTLGLLALR